MDWIALQPSPDDRPYWILRALQFTPRVAAVEEAVLLEVSTTLRLWGGRQNVVGRLLLADDAGPAGSIAAPAWAVGDTALVALALSRLAREGRPCPSPLPDALPLDTLTVARPVAATLERMGCRTWGAVRALPRAGVSRRFGAGLLEALDRAWGQRPDGFAWAEAPERFDLRLELPAIATQAGELLWTAGRQLTLLQAWLRARQQGVLALELEWTHDLRRLNGETLPETDRLEIRTAQAVQGIDHLRRLVGEHLARTPLAAPANHLRLRSLETVPWPGGSHTLLPDEVLEGERLHQLVERLRARLGADNVLVAQARADHRPECRVQWQPDAVAKPSAAPAPAPPDGTPDGTPDVLLPTWILPAPLRLAVRHEKPWFEGPLQLVSRAWRLEAAWWDASVDAPVCRDYFIARSGKSALLWIYRERLSAGQEAPRWFLHGLYA